MFVDTVTITGADDQVERDELYKISDEYPFVEWGILYMPENQGKLRYPTNKWITSFIRHAPRFVRSSLHLCGSTATEFCKEKYFLPYLRDFDRIQVNIHPGINVKPDKIASFLTQTNKVIPTVVQKNTITESIIRSLMARHDGKFIQILFDESRGNGKIFDVASWKEWERTYLSPPPDECQQLLPRCGFAGGISPSNIYEVLDTLWNLDGNGLRSVWIDMESGVRTDNMFDLKKVDLITLAVKHWREGGDRS